MERRWLLGVFAIAVVGLVIPAGDVFAQATLSWMLNSTLVLFASILGWIINMVGYLVVMLVDFLIQIAQYNTFVDAHPVKVGWPLIRDVTNMFFIVILLLIAFAKIIRWNKYSNLNVLPKFLLMAVLINFSLPLIGILIDLSQVLMLTFVNGFKAAATGNFVQVLKLDKIMQLKDVSVDQKKPDNLLVQLVAAEMFGIFILGLTCTLMLIMSVYLVVRIVGLWVALILSPLAFFITAVPSALASKMGGIADDYWGKLTSMLTGGPIMAFFLWLTLATVSSGGLGSIAPAGTNVRQGEQQQAEQYFASAIGNVEDFGIYLFGIIMMFTGLSTAVSASGKLNSTLGSVTGKIKSGGVWASKMAAYGGVLAGSAYAGRQAYRASSAGAKWTASQADQRLGLTKSVGTTIRSAGLAMGMTGLAAAGTHIAGTRGRAAEARGKEFDERAKAMKLTPEEYIKYAKRLEGKAWDRDKSTAMNERLLKMGTKKEGKEALMKEYEEAAKESARKAGLREGSNAENASDEDKKAYQAHQAHVEAYQKERHTEDSRKRLREYEKANAGDEDKIKFAKEMIEANPSLAKDTFKYVMDEMQKDPNYYRKIRLEEFENPEILRAVMASSGVMKAEDGEIDKDHPMYSAFKGNGERAKLFRAYTDDVRRAAQAEKNKDPNALLQDSEALKAAGLVGGRYIRTTDKEHYPEGYQRIVGERLAKTEAAARTEAVPASTANPEARSAEARVAQARERVQRARAMPVGTDRDRESIAAQAEYRQAQSSAVASGARFDRTYEMSGSGAFFSNEDEQHFEEQITDLHRKAETDLSAYENVDMETLMRSPSGDNGARTAFVRQTKVSGLREAYNRAKQSGDAKMVRRVADMVRVLEAEGAKIEGLIRAQNARNQKANEAQRKKFGDNAHLVDIIDENKVLQAAVSGDQAALQAALGSSGLKISMDNAQALGKKTAIAATTEFVDVKKQATSRGGAAIRSAMRAGGDTAGAAAAKASSAASAAASAASAAAASAGARVRRVIGRERERDLEARVEEQERKMRGDVEREDRRQWQGAAREAQAEARKAARDEAARRKEEAREAAEEERKSRGGGSQAT